MLVVVCRAAPEANPADVILREEIEAAAFESRQLADELADMLARLEVEDNREEAVEAAVIGDQNTVEEALKEMVDRIEDLAEASEESDLEDLTGLVARKRVEEEELSKTLEQLSVVAEQIEAVSSSADAELPDKVAQLLQRVSDRIENKSNNNSDDEDEEVFKKEFGTKQSKTGLQLNGIAEMIKALEKVTKDLKSPDNDVNNDQSSSNDFDLDVLQKGSNVNDNETQDELSFEEDGNNSDDRRGKSLNLDEDEDNADIKEDEERAPKQLSEDDKKEECVDKATANRVKVCVPDFETVDSKVELYSGIIKEERHCFDVTKTVCEESSVVVSKEVCVYDYQQKTIVAPAQLTEVTFERKYEKMGVSVCSPGSGYNKKEQCILKYEEAAFRVPSIAEYVDDFVELNIPEPQKSCRVFKYEIPEITCRDVTTEECRDVAFVEPVVVTEHVETVILGYEGECEHKVLEQTQQVCTSEVKVKQPRSGYQG